MAAPIPLPIPPTSKASDPSSTPEPIACATERTGSCIGLDFVALHESAYGPKRTWTSALHMSAFGGKADIHLGGSTDEVRLSCHADTSAARPQRQSLGASNR